MAASIGAEPHTEMKNKLIFFKNEINCSYIVMFLEISQVNRIGSIVSVISYLRLEKGSQ